MATKDNFLLFFKDKQNNVTDNGKHNNFTLNKNHQISTDAFSRSSKSVITERRKALDYDFSNDSQTKKFSHSWKNSTKDLSSFVVNNGSEKEDKLKKRKALNASTLSVYIEGYENSNEANLCNVSKEDVKKIDLIKNGLNAKQIDFDSKAVIQNAFEFSRQQESGEAIPPEIAQFSASQQLLNPNVQTHQAFVQQSLPQNSDEPSANSSETPLTEQQLVERCGKRLTTIESEKVLDQVRKNEFSPIPGTPKIGVLVNGYKILGYLGTGGAGTVCLALKDDLFFALKFIHVKEIIDEPNQEFKVLHELLTDESHEDFMVALEWNEWQNEATDGELKQQGLKLCYLVMKLVGPSLKILSTQEECELSFRRRVPYMQKALKALLLLHKKNYVHNDVKLENFGVDIINDDRVYLLDYGSVNRVPGRTKEKNVIKGTRMYCSRRALKGETQSYRDDCESWFYSFLIFVIGQLPFHFWSKPCKNQRILKIIKHIDLLGFNETINFDFVNECLQELINDEAGIPYFPYLYKMSGRKCMQIIQGDFTFSFSTSSMKNGTTRLICSHTSCNFTIFVEKGEYENAEENSTAVIVNFINKHVCPSA